MRVSCVLLIQRSATGPSASKTHFAQADRRVPPAAERALAPRSAGALCSAALLAAGLKRQETSGSHAPLVPTPSAAARPQPTPALGPCVPARLMCSEKRRLLLRILPDCQQAVETSPVIRPPAPQKKRFFLLQVARLLSRRPGGEPLPRPQTRPGPDPGSCALCPRWAVPRPGRRSPEPLPLRRRSSWDAGVPPARAVRPRGACSWADRPVLVFVGRRVAEKRNNFFEQTKKLFN